MQKTKKTLSSILIAIMLFLNIGLAIGFGGKLHAHFLGNNQILIHFHNMGNNGDHTQGHPNDFSRCPFQNTIAFLTYIDSSQSLYLNKTYCTFEFNYNYQVHTKANNVNLFIKSLRAPPIG